MNYLSIKEVVQLKFLLGKETNKQYQLVRLKQSGKSLMKDIWKSSDPEAQAWHLFRLDRWRNFAEFSSQLLTR